MSRYKITEIKGVIPALMTFFDKEERIDSGRTKAMIDFMIEKGADGFYLTGSTGECFTMTLEERMKATEIALEHINGRRPAIVHVGDIGTKKTIELAKQAYRAGADAISSVPPFYWRFSKEDIYHYYGDLSESVEIPLVVYNIVLAGIMDKELLLKIAGLDNVRGLKYTDRKHDEMGHLKERLGSDFMIYSGCDEMAFSGLCAGADGIIGSFYNVIPDLYKKIVKAVEESRIPDGIRLQKIADEFIFACLKYDFPSILHNVMNWRGLDSGYSRRPFYNYEDYELEDLKEEIKRIRKQYQTRELDCFAI